MNKQKIPYEVPEAQTFVVRCEGVVCQSPVQTSSSTRKSYGFVFDDLDEED